MALKSDSDDFTMVGDSTWITVDNLHVHLIRTDEGVVVDVFKGKLEPYDDPITSTYAYFNEGEEGD